MLRVRDLTTTFATARGPVVAVDRVSLELERGQTLGVVGESGSGKSVLGRTVMGLTSTAPNATVTGSVLFEGVDITNPDKATRARYLGVKIAMIFQDPLSSLNPVKTAGAHITETLRRHDGSLTRREARQRAIELLDTVRIPDPARRFGQYPHELSGGMRQRVCIAIALACRPRLLIADEPTTALDVTVQKHVLDLLGRICQEQGMAMILVSHDLGVVAGRSDKVAVMYAGRVQEEAAAAEFFSHQRHPYSKALLDTKPHLENPARAELVSIPGRPPDPADRFPGCRFAPRCRFAQDRCRVEEPSLSGGAACFFPLDAVSTREAASS